jgi:hypothetical protein
MSYQADAQEALEEYMGCFQGFQPRRNHIYAYVGHGVGMSVVEAAFKAGYNAALGITEVCDD